MGLSQSRNAAASHPISDTADRRASFECGKLCCPEEIRSPPKPETVANPTESSGDEEVESFEGWRSQPTSSGRPSEDLQAGGMSSPKSSQPSGSQGGPSSSEWLGQRPSADTPLPRTSGATKTQRGSASLDARTPRASAQYSNRTSTSTSSGADAQQQQVSSPAASARSSFALERAGAEVNRASLEAFPEECRAPDAGGSGGAGGSGSSGDGAQQQQAYASLELAGAGVTVETVARLAGVPPALSGRFAALCVLPPQTPAPLSALARLWGTDEAEAGATLAALADSAAVNVARLPSGELWALPQAQQLQLLQTACRAAAPGQHARLLDAYVAAAPAAPAPGAAGAADGRAGDRAAAARLRAVPDDGYFLANVGHHLLGAGRAGAARELLLDPGWLAQKLAGCGAAAVVADFRRFLMARPDKDVKLVLEAFQLSVAQAQAHPLVAGLLRCLVAARLMTAPLSAGAAGWPAAQRAAVRADGAAAAARGAPRALPPLTPSLDQAGGLQRLALRGHAGAVTRVLLTPSGTDAVTASADGTARVWDLEIGDCVLTLGGHTGAVTAMGLTADGSLLVTASEDGTARAFEMERGQCLRVLAGHEGAVAALALDPAGRFAVTGGADATARVWDLASARALHVIRAPRPVTALALSPCARFLVLGCADGSARMHDVAGGQLMGAMAGHASWVTAVEFAPDGARCVTAAQDGTARVWDLKTGACRHVLEGHAGRVNALALSGDGRAAATGSDDGTARLWDLRSGACSRVLAGHRGWVGAVALSPGGDRLVTASGDATAVAWDTDTGEAVRVLEGHSGAVLAAAVTRRGRFAVTASEDGTARAWDFAAPAAAAPRWHEGRVRALAARDGVVAATAGDDCVVRLWDARSGEYRGLLRGHATPIRWAAFSADGARLVTASPDRSVMVWDCQTAECLRRMPVHKGSRMKSFAASADLSRGVVCLFDSTVTVWDLEAGAPAAELQRWGQRDEHTGHTSAVNEVLMTADGATVVTLSKDATARIWDAAAGACRHVLRGHTDSVAGGCLSERGGLVATFAFDNSVRLWSLAGGPCLAAIPLAAAVTRMALSACGWQLAAALADGSVVLADLERPREAVRLAGHAGEVTGLAFSADGARLASCSADCTARLWAARGGALEGVFVGDCGLTCCHYDSATESLVLGTDRGVVHFVDAALAPAGAGGGAGTQP